MARHEHGVLNRPIAETPIAIFDFETTGLNAGADRVVEDSVVRIEPGQEPQLVLDTLVNPNRKMAATEIHGITDEDVSGAPKFEDVAGNFLRSISSCVVSSYNIYFDIGFLQFELHRLGLSETPPHLCLMYMRPLLGLGSRCCLEPPVRIMVFSRKLVDLVTKSKLAKRGDRLLLLAVDVDGYFHNKLYIR